MKSKTLKKVPCAFHLRCYQPCPVEAGVLREIPLWHVEGRSKQHSAGKAGSAVTNKDKPPRLRLVASQPGFPSKTK